MILFLIRHGLTPITGHKLTGRLPGHHLSEEGVKQAEAASTRLAGAPLKAIYSSPMERCLETAEVIAARHRVEVQVHERLNEIDYGDWQGKSFKALYAMKGWRQLKARPGDFRFPNGETIREAQTRGVGALEDLRARHRNKAIAVCTHADMVRLIVAAYLGTGLDLYDRVQIAPASISTLALSDGAPQLLNLGDTGGYEDLIRQMRAPAEAAAKKRSGKGKK